jgi:hypothetical protein
MKLVDCEPRFVRYDGNREIEGQMTIANAQGICFDEPAKGVRLCIPFRNRGVPDHINGGQQWEVVSGSSFADLTLSPSIDASKYGLWHGFITNGECV